MTTNESRDRPADEVEVTEEMIERAASRIADYFQVQDDGVTRLFAKELLFDVLRSSPLSTHTAEEVERYKDVVEMETRARYGCRLCFSRHLRNSL